MVMDKERRIAYVFFLQGIRQENSLQHIIYTDSPSERNLHFLHGTTSTTDFWSWAKGTEKLSFHSKFTVSIDSTLS